MTRVPPANDDHIDRRARAVLDHQRQTWGEPLGNHLLYARRPSLFRGVRAMWGGLEESGLLPERLVVLLNRRVASLIGCEF